ncbi:MAG: hypothetical protein LUQ69_07865, partial [Methanoregulaceae archaeon]|nr:hypothetical protein [Methanoregulaceae archaeon]
QNNGPQPGWVITVKNATGDVVGSTTTNADGYWQFCGLIQGIYNVSETMQDGWEAVDPASGYQEATLVDQSVTHVNFTNKRSLCLSGYKLDQNNGPLSGWLITVKNATGSVAGIATTNDDGYWQVCGLIQGTYNVSETMQDNWVAVDPASGYQDATLVDQSVTHVNFTNKRSLCMSGYKLDQNNGPLSGWLITVENETGSVVGSDTTDETGFWQVCGLIQGTYNVSETLQDGWEAIDPASGYQDATLVDQNRTNVNFTNKQKRFCIDGYKLDQTGLALEDWNITVTDESGESVTVPTDEDGFYQVCDLLPGDYTVCEELQRGWMNVTPLCVDVELTDTNIHGINFTNELVNGSVIGWVSSHCNTGSLAVPGVKVCVALTPEDLAAGNSWCSTTDERGIYSILDLPTGVPLYAMATAPGYEKRPISYQVDSGKVIICQNLTSTPLIPPLTEGNMTQVNWFLVKKPSAAYLNGFPMDPEILEQITWVQVNESFSYIPFV